MPDNKTLMDQVHDLRLELKLVRDEKQRQEEVLHTLHRTAASLVGEIEDYKAANAELRYQLELAREEAKQAYKRADNYRNQVTALGERLAATFQIQGDLMRQLEEARNG